MTISESELRERALDARGSPDQLRDLYQQLVDDVGADEAGSMWWATFASTDAAET